MTVYVTVNYKHKLIVTTSVSTVEYDQSTDIVLEKGFRLIWSNKIIALVILIKEQLFLLFRAYQDVFAQDRTKLGLTGKIKHAINTGSSTPNQQHWLCIAPAWRMEMHTLLDDMLMKGIIKPSTSPWALPIVHVLVRKKDGSTRFHIDYHGVKAVTCKDAYPLPWVDDTLDTLMKSNWFATLDLLSSYWKVEVSLKDTQKMAFCTLEGLFEFTLMPFGLSNAPSTL